MRILIKTFVILLFCISIVSASQFDIINKTNVSLNDPIENYTIEPGSFSASENVTICQINVSYMTLTIIVMIVFVLLLITFMWMAIINRL